MNYYDNLGRLTTSEDQKIMDLLLKVPSDEAAWQEQQRRQKPRYLSASLQQQEQRRNEIARSSCTNCGSPHITYYGVLVWL